MKVRFIAGVFVVLMLIALFVGGAQPQAAGLIPVPWDKLAHVAFFYIFTLLLLRFVEMPIALVIVLAVLVGTMDEVHQLTLPGRMAGWDDWLADVAGIGLGLAMFKRQKIIPKESV